MKCASIWKLLNTVCRMHKSWTWAFSIITKKRQLLFQYVLKHISNVLLWHTFWQVSHIILHMFAVALNPTKPSWWGQIWDLQPQSSSYNFYLDPILIPSVIYTIKFSQWTTKSSACSTSTSPRLPLRKLSRRRPVELGRLRRLSRPSDGTTRPKSRMEM